MIDTIKLDTWKKQCFAAFGVYISRFGFLPPNFSPLGSFGFFGGHPLLYFATIVVFDAIRGGFYPGFLFTYLGFLGYSILGKIAAGNTKRQLMLLPAASLFFFLASNFGVWLYWFPHTLEGLIACYLAALPFYQNTFMGDMAFGLSFFVFQKTRGGKKVWNPSEEELSTVPLYAREK